MMDVLLYASVIVTMLWIVAFIGDWLMRRSVRKRGEASHRIGTKEAIVVEQDVMRALRKRQQALRAMGL